MTDAADIQRLTFVIEQLTMQMDRLRIVGESGEARARQQQDNRGSSDAVDKAVDDLGKQMQSFTLELDRIRKNFMLKPDLQEKAKEAAGIQGTAAHRAAEFQAKYAVSNANVDAKMQQLRQFQGGRLGAGPMAPKRSQLADRGAGISAGLGALKSSVLSEVPFGGLLGLMFYGASKDAEWQATTQRIAAGAAQVGGDISGQIKTLGGNVRGLANNFILTEQEMTGALRSLTERGFKDAETGGHGLAKALSTVGGVWGRYLGIGAQFNAQVGDLGRLSSTSAQQAQTAMQGLIGVSGELGLSYNQLAAAQGQAISTARLYTDTQGNLLKMLKEGKDLLKGQGLTDQAAGSIAAQGMQGMAGMVQGMSTGMKAVLADRMAKEAGIGGLGGTAGIRAFETGFRNVEGGGGIADNFYSSMVSALNNTVMKGIKSDADRAFFLRQNMGADVETSETLIALMRAKDTMTNEKFDEWIEKNRTSLDKAYGQLSDRTSPMERILRDLREAVAFFGSGLMKVLMGGFEMLGNLGKYIASSSWLGGDAAAKMLMPDDAPEGADQDYFLKGMIEGNKKVDRGYKDFEKSWSKVKKAAKTIGGVVGVGDETTSVNIKNKTGRKLTFAVFEEDGTVEMLS